MAEESQELGDLPPHIRKARIALLMAVNEMRLAGCNCYEASCILAEMAGQLMAAAVTDAGGDKEMWQAGVESARINFFLGKENFDRNTAIESLGKRLGVDLS